MKYDVNLTQIAIDIVEDFMAKTGISKSMLGTLCAKDGKLIERLYEKRLTLKSVEKLINFCVEHKNDKYGRKAKK